MARGPIVPEMSSTTTKPMPGTAATRKPVFRPEDKVEVLIRVECNSGSDMLTCTHTFFTAYCEANFRPHIAQRLTVAAFELLENGLRYGGIRHKVVIELLQSTDWLAVRVSNEAIPARVAMLREHLARIETNPEAVFVEEMKRSMGGANQRAMLGLARLAHEARLSLTADLHGQMVSVMAYCSG